MFIRHITLQETHHKKSTLNIDTYKLKVSIWKGIYHANIKSKEIGSSYINFRQSRLHNTESNQG